jgi:excisionase family DNA binding protein
MTETEKKLIGVTEIAKLIGVHRNTVSRWHRKQVMPRGMKTGRAFVWSKERVVKWAKEAGLI